MKQQGRVRRGSWKNRNTRRDRRGQKGGEEEGERSGGGRAGNFSCFVGSDYWLSRMGIGVCYSLECY
jgi:hypothetical protein